MNIKGESAIARRRALQRILSSAASLGTQALAADRFVDKRVLLTGDEAALATSNGRTCFEAALHLLIRTSTSVTVQVAERHIPWFADIRRGLEGHPLASHVHWRGFDLFSPEESFEAVLHVGASPAAHRNLTTVHSDGWVVRLASDAPPIPMTSEQTNVVAAVAAAALGTAEVFKRLVEVRSDRGPLHSRLQFSLWDYSDGETGLGAPLPERISLRVLIAGLGAIGSAIAYLLKRLPADGSLWLIDRQSYTAENLGTCIALDAEGLNRPKTWFLERYLSPQYQVKPLPGEVRAAMAAYTKCAARPPTLLGGLDNITARHDLQDFWPDMIVDGALGESFACQVSLWRWRGDGGCLRCQFVEPEVDSIAAVAAVTGLSRDRLAKPDSLITKDDVDAAPAKLRAALARSLGKPVCSVTSRAMIEQLTGKTARVAPSVPFVAVISAAMVVGELLKDRLPYAPVLRNRYQFDVLYGPQGGMVLNETRRPNCTCAAAALTLEKFRAGRDRPQPEDT
jgi:hypothetical protein